MLKVKVLTPNDLTQHEIEALKLHHNVADAHTHQSQSESQKQIVSRLPELWYEAEQTKQADMEARFIETFFRVQGQCAAIETPSMLVYASSVAIVIVANYLMKKKYSVSLIEPCFDNLHDILVHMQIPLLPLDETWLHDTDKIYDRLCKEIKTDAIFLVDPNNPTGFTLTGSGKDVQKGFEEVIRYCVDTNTLLIFDFCFASFLLSDSNLGIFDIYALLEKSGVRYITIEDSGKTWPLQDTKVAILKCSKDLYQEIYSIFTSYLLNVSPFILNVVTEYILDSEKDNFHSVLSLLETNRNIAKKALDGKQLRYMPSKAKVSVVWFEILNSNINATSLQKKLQEAGVYVLPGTYFYWEHKAVGEKYIRIALARDTDIFEKTIKKIQEVLSNI